MRTTKYLLEGRTPVPTESLLEFGRAFEKMDRIVRKTYFPGVEVSTIFLGLDHNWGDGPPLLFETLVFGGKLDREMDRYST